MKKALILGGAALAALCLTAAPALAGGAGEIPLPLQIWGLRFSHHTIIIAAVVAVLVYLFARLCTANLSKDNPGRGQILIEKFVGFFDDLTRQSLGPNRGRKYLPYIGTLFMFVWTCNMMGLIPLSHWHLGGRPSRTATGTATTPRANLSSTPTTTAGRIRAFPFPASRSRPATLTCPWGWPCSLS